MERAEKVGLGVAGAGHLLLFGALSLGFLAAPKPVKLQQQPVEVSLVKDVGLEATAPQAVTPPAQSIAPEQGAPEDAAPPAPIEAAPEPKPIPQPAPAPQPKPVPAKPVPKPAPAPKPAEKAAPAKPKPAPAEKAPPKPTKDTRTAAASPAKAPPAAAKGAGSSPASKATRTRGSRLGPDFLKGLTTDPSPSRSQAPRAAKIDARALASIVQAIARQIQPCADRQVDPGPGANQIVTTLNLRLEADGTLTTTPSVVRQTGLTDENQRYARRVTDLGIAAFKGCTPLKLPAEFYDTPGGGWNNINFNWKLR